MTNTLILKPQHVKAFNFIKSFIKRNKYAPTLKEIADTCGMSRTTAFHALKQLALAGYIVKHGDNRSRSYTILKETI